MFKMLFDEFTLQSLGPHIQASCHVSLFSGTVQSYPKCRILVFELGDPSGPQAPSIQVAAHTFNSIGKSGTPPRGTPRLREAKGGRRVAEGPSNQYLRILLMALGSGNPNTGYLDLLVQIPWAVCVAYLQTCVEDLVPVQRVADGPLLQISMGRGGDNFGNLGSLALRWGNDERKGGMQSYCRYSIWHQMPLYLCTWTL